MEFRWNDWNVDHATQHGVTLAEIEWLVETARPPYPEDIGGGKRIVVARGTGGRFIQVIYVPDPEGTLFVIHARPLDDHEKRRFRRRTR